MYKLSANMANERKKIAILGATGSVGQQALQVIAEHADLFEVTLLAAHSKWEQLYADALRFRPQALMVTEAEAMAHLTNRLQEEDPSPAIRVYPLESFATVLKAVPIDLVLVAVVGFAGLAPTLDAIAAGKTIALANKEALVAGGSLVMEALKQHDTKLYPVDSEHSAIFQCLMGEDKEAVQSLTLTASGGPFWSRAEEDMHAITPEMALAHPNWDMGAKVSIDSATMMNKGLEVIEAYWLFGLPLEKIKVVVHRQSWVHALVQFIDGSQKAHLGPADMRLPIQFALSYPERISSSVPLLDLSAVRDLSFEAPDYQRFPALPLCYDTLEQGGNKPCALNAANECAVTAFLDGDLSFMGIVPVVTTCLQKIDCIERPSYIELAHTDAEARKITQELITTWKD